MNLQFTNKGGNFVSEFEVTSDFNLHIEGVRLSDMHIYQKTAGGSYAKVTDFPSERSQDRVADFDFASLVYPKFIKVVCATEPTYAEIATDGEVTEIKSQSKEVEITSNGVTEIAPDAGFGYLSGVKVNVNVPTGGGGGGSKIEYFLYDKNNSLLLSQLLAMAFELKAEVNVEGTTRTVVGPCRYVNFAIEQLGEYKSIAFSICLDAKTNIFGAVQTIRDSFIAQGMVTPEDFAALPRITEEEFYAI